MPVQPRLRRAHAARAAAREHDSGRHARAYSGAAPPVNRCGRANAEHALEPERERLAGEVLAHVERQPRAEVVDELDGRRATRGELAALGVLRELRRRGRRVGQLGRAGRDAGEVAVPQAGELQAVVQRGRPRAALGAARLLADLRLALAVLLAREELQLLGEPLLVRRARGRAARRRELEQREPRPLGADAAVQRRARERLGVRAQRGAVPERERERALAVAEAQPRGGLGLRRARRRAPAAARRARAGGGGSKRTGWQREAIVGSTCVGRSVSSSSTT